MLVLELRNEAANKRWYKGYPDNNLGKAVAHASEILNKNYENSRFVHWDIFSMDEEDYWKMVDEAEEAMYAVADKYLRAKEG